MALAEKVFVQNFIARDKRERWLEFLVSEKNRLKVVSRLFDLSRADLDPRFIYERDRLPPGVTAGVEKLLTQWKEADPKQLCHVIAYSSDRDGVRMRLDEAERDTTLMSGAVFILIPDRLAYYQTDRQPDKVNKYVLFRP
jgi:hypothetical protein